jgi:putative endonuclease
LVWYQVFDDMATAIAIEKAMKKWNRSWKVRRIVQMNPDWCDLWSDITE